MPPRGQRGTGVAPARHVDRADRARRYLGGLQPGRHAGIGIQPVLVRQGRGVEKAEQGFPPVERLAVHGQLVGEVLQDRTDHDGGGQQGRDLADRAAPQVHLAQ